MNQLSLLDAPPGVDSRLIPTAPKPEPQLTVGALVVPKIREGYTTPLFLGQVLSLEDIQRANVEKLKERFPEGFTTADSVARVDVAGGAV